MVTATGAEIKKLGPTPDNLYGICLSRDGKTVATIGYAGNLMLWSLDQDKPLFARKLKPVAYCLAVAPDGKSVVTGHDDHVCYITALPALPR